MTPGNNHYTSVQDGHGQNAELPITQRNKTTAADPKTELSKHCPKPTVDHRFGVRFITIRPQFPDNMAGSSCSLVLPLFVSMRSIDGLAGQSDLLTTAAARCRPPASGRPQRTRVLFAGCLSGTFSFPFFLLLCVQSLSTGLRMTTADRRDRTMVAIGSSTGKVLRHTAGCLFFISFGQPNRGTEQKRPLNTRSQQENGGKVLSASFHPHAFDGH